MSVADYGIHIAPITAKTREGYEKVQQAIVCLILHVRSPRHLPRSRKMIRLEPIDYRSTHMFCRLEEKTKTTRKAAARDETEKIMATEDVSALRNPS